MDTSFKRKCLVQSGKFILVFGAWLFLTAFGPKVEETMRNDLPLYEWMRAGYGIHLAEVAKAERIQGQVGTHFEADDAENQADIADDNEERAEGAGSSGVGTEIISIQMRIHLTLFGSSGERVRIYRVRLPVSESARLRFPDPFWGRVTLQPGTKALLVTNGRGLGQNDLIYVEEFKNIQDPTLLAMQDIIGKEKADQGTRGKQYLAWLSEPWPLYALFAGEALARDSSLFAPKDIDTVVAIYAKAFLGHPDVGVRLSLCEWLWQDIFSKVEASGETAIINATVSALQDPSEDVRILAFDSLLGLDSAKKLERPGIAANPNAAAFLREQLEGLTEPYDRERVQRLIKSITK